MNSKKYLVISMIAGLAICGGISVQAASPFPAANDPAVDNLLVADTDMHGVVIDMRVKESMNGTVKSMHDTTDFQARTANSETGVRGKPKIVPVESSAGMIDQNGNDYIKGYLYVAQKTVQASFAKMPSNARGVTALATSFVYRFADSEKAQNEYHRLADVPASPLFTKSDASGKGWEGVIFDIHNPDAAEDFLAERHLVLHKGTYLVIWSLPATMKEDFLSSKLAQEVSSDSTSGLKFDKELMNSYNQELSNFVDLSIKRIQSADIR